VSRCWPSWRAIISARRDAAGTHLVRGLGGTERFGVSRGPVRDALRPARAGGVVDTRGRGSLAAPQRHDLGESTRCAERWRDCAVRESAAPGCPPATGQFDEGAADARDRLRPVTRALRRRDWTSTAGLLRHRRQPTGLAAAWATHRDLLRRDARRAPTPATGRPPAPGAEGHAALARVVRAGDVPDASRRATRTWTDRGPDAAALASGRDAGRTS